MDFHKISRFPAGIRRGWAMPREGMGPKKKLGHTGAIRHGMENHTRFKTLIVFVTTS